MSWRYFQKREPLSVDRACAVIVAPVVTEKATMVSGNNTYVFRVAPGADKIMIARALKALFDVEVVSVRTLPRPSRRVRFRQRKGVRSGFRKAMVTLASGQSIDLGGDFAGSER